MEGDQGVVPGQPFSAPPVNIKPNAFLEQQQVIQRQAAELALSEEQAMRGKRFKLIRMSDESSMRAADHQRAQIREVGTWAVGGCFAGALLGFFFGD